MIRRSGILVVALAVALGAVAATALAGTQLAGASQKRALTRLANRRHACGFDAAKYRLKGVRITSVATAGRRIDRWAGGYFGSVQPCEIVFSRSRATHRWKVVTWGSSPCVSGNPPAAVCDALRAV
jgi:hypothetical protein